MEAAKIQELRNVITENLRVQRGGSDTVRYIDIGSVLSDAAAHRLRLWTLSLRRAKDSEWTA